MLDNNPRFQRWIGFWMIGFALVTVMWGADAFGWPAGMLAAVSAFCAIWLLQKADDHPERIAARNAEVARIERELDD
jgi:hypothetical protein